MTTSSKAASVTFDNVTKAYGDVVAVRDVSFTIEPGSLVTLLGPSGCGKTTTLRLVAGLEMLTKGRVLIGDTDVSKLPATQRDVSMVFQSYALFPHMTVLENVAYGLVVSGQPKPEAHQAAEEGLKQVGLGGYGARLPSELSGGQQQRVAVARALVLSGPRGNPRTAEIAGPDHHIRHPRSGRGVGGIRPHHRNERGGNRAGRQSA
jgi:iron(III) transport system ATP-binding protein